MSDLDLYDFQKEDVEKILSVGNGLIGSEMGVGKTLEAIKLDEGWWFQGALPTLVIAPLNTFDSWVEKYNIMSPSTDVVVIDRKDRSKFIEARRKRQGDVFLMHWDALRLMPELANFEWNVVIADEVHRAANRKSQTTQALFRLRAKHRLAMSGTASGDQPHNLWSILHFVWPTYYRSYWKFWKHYVIEDTGYAQGGAYRKVVGVKNVDHLQEEIKPWYIRHLKREQCCEHHPEGVMSWLPEKTYDKIWVDLSSHQRKVYDQMRDKMVAWVGEHENSPLVAGVVVAQLARLSQMALAAPYIEDDGTVRLEMPSSKMDALYELIKDHPDKKFVVFSASKKMCYLTQQEMTRKGIGCFVLSGDTPQTHRNGMVRNFTNDPSIRLFIGVIEAAAEGIDGLQHATDTAIFLDRSWRTIKNKQAEDRLHRGGQKDTVQIIDIMAKDTIDMGRLQKLETKWAWIKAILGDDFNNRVDISLLA